MNCANLYTGIVTVLSRLNTTKYNFLLSKVQFWLLRYFCKPFLTHNFEKAGQGSNHWNKTKKDWWRTWTDLSVLSSSVRTSMRCFVLASSRILASRTSGESEWTEQKSDPCRTKSTACSNSRWAIRTLKMTARFTFYSFLDQTPCLPKDRVARRPSMMAGSIYWTAT